MNFNNRYMPGIGRAAGAYMIKWNIMDQHMQSQMLKLNYGEEVNVFINFESVLDSLTLQKNLTTSISFYKRDVVVELESSILNLVANYKMYFNKERCIPNIYLYYTDLKDESQQMKIYNKYYRDYYHNRYTRNPQFRLMGSLMTDTIVPEIELIMSYVPKCYFIKTKTFDASLVPYVISSKSSNKNVIITGDIFDTLYMFNPNFITIYIKRKFKDLFVASDIDSAIQSIIKDENPIDLNIFRSEMYYRLLMSIVGSKIRNIEPINGFTYRSFMLILKSGINNGVVLNNFSSIDSIIELFQNRFRDQIKTNFICTDLDTQYQLLSETDKSEICDQIIDRIDNESLEALNNKRFFEYPINLQGLMA